MKKQMLMCLVSAGAGVVLALMLTDPSVTPQVAAQEQGRPPLPRQQTPFGSPGTLSSTGASSPENLFGRRPGGPAFDEQYTPEERVNIAVYENVNRSVVNINTKGTQ